MFYRLLIYITTFVLFNIYCHCSNINAVYSDKVKINIYDTNTVNKLIYFSSANITQNTDKATNAAKLSFSLSQKLNYDKGIINSCKILGYIYTNKGNFNNAFEYYNILRNVYVKKNDKKGLGSCINNIGALYFRQGNYIKALESYQKSLSIYDEIDDKRGIAGCYNNIGIIFQKLNNNNKAIEYLYKALKISVKINDKVNLSECYNNIGLIYYSQGEQLKALEYYSKALEIFEETVNKEGISIGNINIGIIHKERGEYKLAFDNFQKSLILFKEMNYQDGIANCNNNLSELSISLKNYQQAINYAKEALKIANKIKSLENKQSAYHNLSIAYDSIGVVNLSHKYYILYSKTKDSIIDMESKKKIIEMEAKYESEKKEKEIIEKNTRIELLEKSKELEKYRLWGLISLIFVSLLISFIIVYNLKKRIKLNNRLYSKNIEFIETQKLLTEAKLNNQKLEAEQLQKELEYKNQEIMNFALHIAEKNDFLEKLKAELINSKDSIKPEELIKIINFNLKSLEKEKKEFEAYVENINQAFFMKLREKIPDITKNEERLAALLRINLSTKEIASIFNISVKGVEVSRYRLRKKLNLDKNANLHDYFSII